MQHNYQSSPITVFIDVSDKITLTWTSQSVVNNHFM